MVTDFRQPDPNTCVPTSFAYLLYKTKHSDFQKTLDRLVPECYKEYNLAAKGMEFDQMKHIADTLQIPCEFTVNKPPIKEYLVGVSMLPKEEFSYTPLINSAIKEGALKIENNYFKYPFAHSVAVFEHDDGTCNIFDSYFGVERTITFEELNADLQKPITYLYIP